MHDGNCTKRCSVSTEKIMKRTTDNHLNLLWHTSTQQQLKHFKLINNGKLIGRLSLTSAYTLGLEFQRVKENNNMAWKNMAWQSSETSRSKNITMNPAKAIRQIILAVDSFIYRSLITKSVWLVQWMGRLWLQWVQIMVVIYILWAACISTCTQNHIH